MGKAVKGSKIPNSDSVQELAAFWDSHSVADCEDELEEITEKVFDRRSSVTVPLDPHEMNAIVEIAGSRGVEPTELLRIWVQEKIRG